MEEPVYVYGCPMPSADTKEMAVLPAPAAENDPTFDPVKLRPLGPWMVVQEQKAAEKTAGGIWIPETSPTMGRRNCIGKVLAVGSGWGKGKDGKGFRYDMPKPGTWLCYPAVASLPTTQQQIQRYGMEGCFLLHAIDANLEIELEPGEALPRIE